MSDLLFSSNDKDFVFRQVFALFLKNALSNEHETDDSRSIQTGVSRSSKFSLIALGELA